MWSPFGPPPPEHSTEPIPGWRAWPLHRTAGGLRIAPTTPRADWEPRVALHARCAGSHTRVYMVYNPELEASHRSPEPGCTCGIHAMKEPRRLRRSRPGRNTSVIGTVAMWDRVIEHTRDWRCEFAYPSRLRLICVWCLWSGRACRRPCSTGTAGSARSAPHIGPPPGLGSRAAGAPVGTGDARHLRVDLLPVEGLAP